MSDLFEELILAKASNRQLNIDTPVNLAGYAKQSRIANKIDIQLELNFVLIAGAEFGTQILIITLDALYFSKTITEDISDKYPQYQIIFCASHTHFAPNIDDSKSSLGEYNKQFHDQVLKLICEEVQMLGEKEYRLCKLSLHKTNVDGAANRRKPRIIPIFSRNYSNISMSPNYKYPYANLLRLVKFFTLRDVKNGKLVALVWNWACHPTGYPCVNVSSDYIGYVRNNLRSTLKGDIPILFMQGFSGDIRPDGGDISTRWFLSMKLYLLGLGFKKMTLEKYKKWCESIANSITTTLESCRVNQEIEKISRLHFTKTHFNISFYIPSLGHQVLEIKKIETSLLTIISVNAEPTFEWSVALSKKFVGEFWTVGCEGNTFGYLPYGHQINEGGYEVDGYLKTFGKINCKIKNYTNDLIDKFSNI